jgi:hypothetical protein
MQGPPKADGRYSDAYQLYAKTVVAKAQVFRAPLIPEIKSADDFGHWLGDLITAYLAYLSEKPSDDSCDVAVAKLRELTPQAKDTAPKLKYVENRAVPESRATASIKDYLHYFQNRFPEQVSLPPAAQSAATHAYQEGLSIVFFEGDDVSHFEGVIYSPVYHVAVPLSLDWQPTAGAGFMLKPGSWIVITKIDRSQSDPRSTVYLDARDIEGRYAASFIDVPNSPHILRYQLMVRRWVPFGPDFPTSLEDAPSEQPSTRAATTHAGD